MENIIKVENTTKIGVEKQNQRLRLFAKVDIDTKLQIMQNQKLIFHKLKATNDNVDNTILTLSSLILAIDTFAKKNDNVNLNAIKLRTRYSKSKVKRQRILGYWSIVRTLKIEHKMSFRDIATYFAKYHKLNVSYSTIYELWNEIENNIKKKDN